MVAIFFFFPLSSVYFFFADVFTCGGL